MQQTKSSSKSFTGISLYIFTAKFFPAIAFSVVWMYASKQLSTEHYGMLQKFWSQLFVLTAIGSIGFPIFILTYSAPRAIAILKLLNRKSIAYYLLFLGSLTALFGYLQLQQMAGLSIPSCSLFILFVALILADALLLVFRSFKVIIAINIGYAFCFGAIHYWQIRQGFNLPILISTLTVLCGIRLFFCLLFIRKKYLHHTDAEGVIDITEEWPSIRKLWLQLGLNDMISVLFRWIDKFILSLLLGKELFALYFNGTTEIPVLPILFSAVSSAAVQHWANTHISKERENKIPLLHYSARILSSIMFPLFCFFLFFRTEFLTVIFSEQYLPAVWIFVCTQLVLPVRAYPFTALLQSEHRGDIINKGAIIDFVMACILMYPLYLLIGLPGVALSFVVSTYWQASYYLFQTSKITNIPVLSLIPLPLLLRKLLLFVLVFGMAYWLINMQIAHATARFFIGLILLVLISSFSLWQDWRKENI